MTDPQRTAIETTLLWLDMILPEDAGDEETNIEIMAGQNCRRLLRAALAQAQGGWEPVDAPDGPGWWAFEGWWRRGLKLSIRMGIDREQTRPTREVIEVREINGELHYIDSEIDDETKVSELTGKWWGINLPWQAKEGQP